MKSCAKVFFLLVLMSMDSFVLAADSLSRVIEGYRSHLPAPERWETGRGVSFIDENGKAIPLAHLRELGVGLKIENKEDLIVLVSYLRDSDRRLAFIAACRFRAGLPVDEKEISAPNPKVYFSVNMQEAFNSYVNGLVENFSKYQFDVNVQPDDLKRPKSKLSEFE